MLYQNVTWMPPKPSSWENPYFPRKYQHPSLQCLHVSLYSDLPSLTRMAYGFLRLFHPNVTNSAIGSYTWVEKSSEPHDRVYHSNSQFYMLLMFIVAVKGTWPKQMKEGFILARYRWWLALRDNGRCRNIWGVAEVDDFDANWSVTTRM